MAKPISWQQHFRRIICYVAMGTLLLFMSPLVAFADDEIAPTDPPAEPPVQVETPPAPPVETPPTPPPADPPVTTTPPSDPTPGPQQPNGPDANTYTYNEQTGLWENGTYSWNPTTKQTEPLVAPEYSYNPTTKQWDTTEWIYDAPSGKYIPNVISVATPPAGAQIADTSAQSSPSTPGDVHSSAVQPALATGSSPSPTPKSDNTSHGVFDLFYNALISNNIDSTAITGNALVAMNTLAGNAISGSASVIANIINLLQSSWSTAADTVTTFVGNLMGDMFGDLFIDPGHMGSNGNSPLANTIINSSQNSAIDNTVKLQAVSGDATVSQNTQAGNAQSGDATAMANLINAINSSIATRQSFVGMLNIFGNLNGDILLPPDLINTLLAANAVGNLDTSNISNSDVLGNFSNSQSITNNVTASATSGGSNVTDNTSAGSATTGDASTNVTVLNLTGRQVVGKNALLVFVNVLGKWVGVIVDAPTGSTSAALGSGITENGSLAINADTNQAITNNVDIGATTGDATVASNTHAGNATSGNARTAVNILNINNSNFALSDWFGVLFINVFGTWNGSFGVDTAAGNAPASVATPSASTSHSLTTSDIRAFKFVPSGHGSGSYSLEPADNGAAALASAHILGKTTTPPKQTQHQTDTKNAQNSNWLFSIIGVAVAASLLGTERVITSRTHHKLN